MGNGAELTKVLRYGEVIEVEVLDWNPIMSAVDFEDDISLPVLFLVNPLWNEPFYVTVADFLDGEYRAKAKVLSKMAVKKNPDYVFIDKEVRHSSEWYTR